MSQNAWTLSYVDVMGLCRLAYKSSGRELAAYEFGGRNWRIIDIKEQGSFRAITAQGRDLQNNQKTIVSFAGSDDGGDWTGANLQNPLFGAENTGQYQLALQYGRAQRPDYFTGHSLGGGLALYSCVLTNTRTATINPSPLFNDIFGIQFNRYNSTAQAINYCVDFEILAAGRNTASVGAFGVAVGATPGRRVRVASSGGSPVAKHLLNNLQGFIEPRKVN